MFQYMYKIFYITTLEKKKMQMKYKLIQANASTMQKIKKLTTNGMYHKNVYILKHKRRGECEIFKKKSDKFNEFQ